MKQFYDRNRGESREYKKGDKVWLEGTNITTDRPAKKLDDKRHGPFIVEKKVGKASYKLKLPKTWKKIHPVFNEVLLSPFIPPKYKSQKPPDLPPPVMVDDEEEYEVEELMDSRMRRDKLEYLVKWGGYPNRIDWTWEPEDKIDPDNRDEFHNKHPNAPRRITVHLKFHQIFKDNLPINIPNRIRSSTGQIFNWEDGKLEDPNRKWGHLP